MSDLISRQAAIDAMFAGMPGLMFNDVLKILRTLPSAHPEMDEWCTDCREYDNERHCCPRFNRVIREALSERKTGRWKLGPFDRIGGYWTTCSVCERPSFGGGKYCRYCGADMRTPAQVQMDETDDVTLMGGDNGKTD